MGLPSKQYQPSYDPPDLQLKSGVEGKSIKPKQQRGERVKELALSSKDEKKRTIEEIDDTEPSAPLTEAEAEAIQADMQRMLQRIDRIQAKTAYLHSQMDKSIDAMGDSKTAFIYNLNNRPRLKKAVRAVFGYLKPIITYNDYLKALELKRRLESEETAAVFEKEDFDG